jgi:transposase
MADNLVVKVHYGSLDLLHFLGHEVKLLLTLKTMSKRERRSYEKAFKMMAVEPHLNGKTSIAAGEEPGIAPDLVRRWAREIRKNDSRSFPGNGIQNLTDEQKGIIRNRKLF